ncbi:MAG: hypothetical protein ACYCQJ_06050 [Nitrososphaerales archaeon]
MKNELAISKDVLDELPLDYEKTSLGDPRGARAQFRKGNIHIREYEDSFTIHIDRYDPRKRPIAHLLRDAPETVGAFLVSSRLSKKQSCSVFSFFSTFLILNHLFRSLKEIIFE